MLAAPTSETHEHLLRPLAPEVLAVLVRRYGPFDACEDAVQEALLAAVRQWPETGVPENPRAWLLTAASRRLIDEFRSDAARRRREQWDALRTTRQDTPAHDDSLGLLFLCCHEALSPPSQIALTLRAVGGLTTAEIASAFLIPEATMAQRISRAKRTVAEAGALRAAVIRARTNVGSQPFGTRSIWASTRAHRQLRRSNPTARARARSDPTGTACAAGRGARMTALAAVREPERRWRALIDTSCYDRTAA